MPIVSQTQFGKLYFAGNPGSGHRSTVTTVKRGNARGGNKNVLRISWPNTHECRVIWPVNGRDNENGKQQNINNDDNETRN